MTVVVTTNWFIYLYFFLEWYVYTLSLELKVKAYYEYHEQKAIQEKEDCSRQDSIAAQSLNESPIEVVVPLQVIKPELDTAAEDLLAELTKDLGLESGVETDHHPHNSEDEFDAYVAFMDVEEYEDDVYLVDYEPEMEQEEDCIQLGDLLSEEQHVSPTGYEEYASAKIADGVEGAQQWVVTIVGMEDSYIHVSDGKRLWVNVGEHAASLHNRDVLKLDVVRKGKEVTVENLFLLEKDVAIDYIIPDEQYSHLYESDYAVAI